MSIMEFLFNEERSFTRECPQGNPIVKCPSCGTKLNRQAWEDHAAWHELDFAVHRKELPDYVAAMHPYVPPSLESHYAMLRRWVAYAKAMRRGGLRPTIQVTKKRVYSQNWRVRDHHPAYLGMRSELGGNRYYLALTEKDS